LTYYLLAGLTFGFTAGISPGPLLTLVVSETLKYGKKEGIKVAMAPLLTDLPIVALSLFVLSRLANFHAVLGTIAILGGIFVAILGWENIRAKSIEINNSQQKSHPIRKGVIVNALNPHPYLFWLTVGAPLTCKAYQIGLCEAVCFILTFYLLLVSTKIGLALLVDKSREFIKNKTYIWTLRILGIILWIFAIILIKDGLKSWGILKGA